MKEVFEKIRERLEEKLKEPQYQHHGDNYYVGIYDAIEIVNQVEEEYTSEDVPIDALGLSVRPLNILKRKGIKTVKELCRYTATEVRVFRNMGNKSFEEIEEKLKEYGWSLKGANYVPEINVGENDGWIPCSEELPPQPKENPLFDNKPLELYLVSLNSTDYPWRAFWNGEFFTDGWSKVEPIAWQPLPKPYKPKG